MPGIFGIAGNHGAVQSRTALAMAEGCVHTDTHRVHATRSLAHAHFSQVDYIWNQSDAIATVGHATCCIWGEFYDVDGWGSAQEKKLSPSELLANAAGRMELRQALESIEGAFVAAIYDSQADKIWLACDKMGLVHLYLYADETNNFVAWGTETKSLFQLPNSSLSVDDAAIQEFRRLGQLTGLRTLHREIQLVEPAALIEISASTGKVQSKTRYWKPRHNHPSGSFRGNQNDAANEMGSLFRKALECRMGSDQKIGILLSGGLDSRALVAGIHGKEKSICNVTFGFDGCEDFKIAKRVSTLANRQHHFVQLGKENWLQDRAQGVWATDGQLNILHMHAIACARKIHQQNWFHSHVSGHLGDAILGGSYLSPSGPDLIEKLDNRGRRFITEGLRLTAQYYDYRRCPFIDTRLIDLVVSLPEAWLRHSALYNRMLLQEFPEYFKTIPWQSTGLPITASRVRVRSRQIRRSIHQKLRNRLPAVIPPVRNTNYVDYRSWLREDPGKKFFEEILFSENAIYPEFVSRDETLLNWRQFQSGRPSSVDQFGTIVTLEIFLQSIENRCVPQMECPS